MRFLSMLPEGRNSIANGDLRYHPSVKKLSDWTKLVLDLMEPTEALSNAVADQLKGAGKTIPAGKTIKQKI